MLPAVGVLRADRINGQADERVSLDEKIVWNHCNLAPFETTDADWFVACVARGLLTPPMGLFSTDSVCVPDFSA